MTHQILTDDGMLDIMSRLVALGVPQADISAIIGDRSARIDAMKAEREFTDDAVANLVMCLEDVGPETAGRYTEEWLDMKASHDKPSP